MKSISNNQRVINIACSADDKFAQHLCVTLFSLLQNSSKDFMFNVYILDCGISESRKSKIIKSLTQFEDHSKISFIRIDLNQFLHLKETKNISRAAYARLNLPFLLPNTDRILYLDSDIVVEGDIAEIFFLPFAGALLYAVRDPNVLMEIEYKDSLGIPATNGYFNSGVMLIDMKAFRENCIPKRLMTSLESINSLNHSLDQSALNAVLWNSWRQLPLEWNFLASLSFYSGDNHTTYSKKELTYAKINPKIIHYASPFTKPWLYESTGPFKARYFLYLNQTCFKEDQPKFILKKVPIKIVYYIYFHLTPSWFKVWLRSKI